MIISVDGVMPMFHDKVQEIVEAVDGLGATRTKVAGARPTSVTFSCEGDDTSAVQAKVKSAIKASNWGKAHVFNVVVS